MFLAPKHTYGPNLFEIFVGELGGPKIVSAYLHVSEKTVKRWLREGNPPRSAVLGLFWESSIGRSHIFTDQVNEIRHLYRRLCLVEEQYIRAKDIVAGLRRLHAGSANEAIYTDLTEFHELPSSPYRPSKTAHHAPAELLRNDQPDARSATDSTYRPNISTEVQKVRHAKPPKVRAMVH